jgi:hydroxymethylbilane synthase
VTPLRIGTRGSALALAQASWVKQQIERVHPDAGVELRIIKTSGDRFVDTAISNIGGKGVFTKEIEDALLCGQIDLAVHSLKDLPTQLPEGLVIAAVPPREDARDVLVARRKQALSALPPGSKIGTGSLRRRAQLLHFRSELAPVAIRGNIDTRLKKLDAGEVDALVLAAAGLRRLGKEDRIAEFLSDEVCVSAVGQGALGIESRKDGRLGEWARLLHHPETFAEITAERALLDRLGGGCHVPIGARARVEGKGLKMVGIVASLDGASLCRGEIGGEASEAAELGRRLAEQLIAKGADKLLSMP